MQDFDVALKLLLRPSAKRALLELADVVIEKWIDAELPKVQNTRGDLLGETASGDLVHVELQSGNDALMPLRTAEYCLGIFRVFGRFPRQVLLYVGEPPLRMASELRGPDVLFRYRAIDIREIDGDRLLESDGVGDNVIAILAKLRDRRQALHKIVSRLAGLPPEERREALDQLLILAGLRKLAGVVKEEMNAMPIQIDLMENEVIADYYNRSRQEGVHEGEIAILRRQIEKRLGVMPEWAQQRLAGRTTEQLEQLSVRLLDAGTLEELLK